MKQNETSSEVYLLGKIGKTVENVDSEDSDEHVCDIPSAVAL